MHPIRPSHAQQGTQATREPPARAAQTIPATHFKPHFVVGGGDCLFHALRMGHTNQPDVPVSMEHIMSLRQEAANYVAEHRSVLITHPSLAGEAGVNALYGLLITQGQWNENAGDLVPPILARVLGREIRILEPAQHGGSYDANENRTFKPQDTDTGLPPGKPDMGQPPIYLAHISRAHYEYLERRDLYANAIPESITTDSIECLSDTFSLGNTSTKEWIDLLLNEEENNPRGDVAQPPSSQASSFARVSSLSSLESYSSRGFLEHFAAKEKNNPTEGVDQPPQKRPRHAEQRREQEGRVVKGRGPTPSVSGKKQVVTQSARNEIKKAFTEATNNRPFDALKQDEQAAEVARISQKTGYRPSGVLTTLTGGGNRPVRAEIARKEITKAFTKANDSPFGALTPEAQDAEVMRISRETGYNPSGVQTTLNGGGNKPVTTRVARNKVTNTFTKANDSPFGALTPEAQDAEVTRISRETGYNPSAVRTTLVGRGTNPVISQVHITQITNAFTDEENNRSFDALTKDEQATLVMRISQKTGHRPSGILATLNGEGTKQVQTHVARAKIKKAFTKTNNHSFNTLTQEKQSTEVTRISKATGYNISGVRTALNGEGNIGVRTQVARAQIKKVFTEANKGSFDALTKDEQTAEVTRISEKTGYRPSGVRTTLTGKISS